MCLHVVVLMIHKIHVTFANNVSVICVSDFNECLNCLTNTVPGNDRSRTNDEMEWNGMSHLPLQIHRSSVEIPVSKAVQILLKEMPTTCFANCNNLTETVEK